MATYTKETALYDTGAIADDIGQAGETASKYITAVDQNGIKVHAENNTNVNYTVINAEGMEVYDDSVSVAKFGAVTRIGTEDDTSITIDDTSIVGVGEDGKKFFNFANSDSIIRTTSIKEISYSMKVYPKTKATALEYTPDFDPVFIAVKWQTPTAAMHYFATSITPGTAVTKTQTFTLDSVQYTASLYYDGQKTFKTWIDKNTSDHKYIKFRYELGKNTLAPSYEIGSGEATGGYALAEGGNTVASGNYSHAEGGYNTTASGHYSHAEGYYTTASGAHAHSEGGFTKATEENAHAEGYFAEANGLYSHAQNRHTIANGESQTVIGRFNTADTTSAFIIGNGTNTASSTRSNALTVDWSGNVNIASGAKYKINGTELSASDVSAVPTTRTVNNKTLSADITLSASDVSAVPTTRKVNNKALSADITLSASDVSAVPTTRKVNNKALSADITLSASDVSAVPTTRTVNSKALSADITLSASDVGAVPTTRTVNSKALSADISLAASDVGAVPTTRTVNSKALSADISLSAADVGAVPTTRTVNGKALSANIADADYVTDAGTSGSWTYRKWNSGKVEAWCGYSFASAASTVWASPIRYWDKTISIPSGIFSTTPRLIVSSQSNQYWVGGASASSATAGTARVLTVASGSMAVNLSIYAVSG